MSSPSAGKRRMDTDVIKLYVLEIWKKNYNNFFFIYYTDFNINLLFTSTYRIESKYEVTILGGLNEFAVKFYGPRGSRSFWFLSVELFITQISFRSSLWRWNMEGASTPAWALPIQIPLNWIYE